MSTVCVARVRGWAGVGACSAEGVGDGPDPAGGRLGVLWRRSGTHAEKASKHDQWSLLLAYSRCCLRFSPLMPAGPDFTPRNPGKRYNCIFYWLTRHVALVLACLCPQGRSLGTQTFRVAWVFRILLTHTFRAAGVLHFSPHTLSGRFLTEIEKNDLKVKTSKFPLCARAIS